MGESMITSFDGTKLYLKKETAADNKAVIVIVHGLCEHQGRYDYFAEKLHEAGIGTYRFDHRGHGRSEGEETFYSDFNELLDDTNVVVDMAIEENPDIPVFLLGHSMGTVFQIPWTFFDEKTEWKTEGIRSLKAMGFKTAAMALREDSFDIDDPHLMAEEKLAVVLGTEGDGLASKTIADCDYTVCIPMAHGVDSLNVAAASAVAFWQLGKR